MFKNKDCSEGFFAEVIDYFGESSQIDKAIVELGELQDAIETYDYYKETNPVAPHASSKESEDGVYLKIIDNVYDKLADVMIMINQLKLIFNSNDKLKEHMWVKLKRLARKMKEKKS